MTTLVVVGGDRMEQGSTVALAAALLVLVSLPMQIKVGNAFCRSKYQTHAYFNGVLASYVQRTHEILSSALVVRQGNNILELTTSM